MVDEQNKETMTGEDVAREIMNRCVSCPQKKGHWKNVTLGGLIIEDYVNAKIDAFRAAIQDELNKKLREITQKWDDDHKGTGWSWRKLLASLFRVKE